MYNNSSLTTREVLETSPPMNFPIQHIMAINTIIKVTKALRDEFNDTKFLLANQVMLRQLCQTSVGNPRSVAVSDWCDLRDSYMKLLKRYLTLVARSFETDVIKSASIPSKDSNTKLRFVLVIPKVVSDSIYYGRNSSYWFTKAVKRIAASNIPENNVFLSTSNSGVMYVKGFRWNYNMLSRGLTLELRDVNTGLRFGENYYKTYISLPNCNGWVVGTEDLIVRAKEAMVEFYQYVTAYVSAYEEVSITVKSALTEVITNLIDEDTLYEVIDNTQFNKIFNAKEVIETI